MKAEDGGLQKMACFFLLFQLLTVEVFEELMLTLLRLPQLLTDDGPLLDSLASCLTVVDSRPWMSWPDPLELRLQHR